MMKHNKSNTADRYAPADFFRWVLRMSMEEEMKQNEIIKRGEFNVKNFRLVFNWAPLFACVIFGAFYLYILFNAILFSKPFQAAMLEHIKCSVGIPLSVFFATVLVIVFERYSGNVQLKLPGFEVNGAAGPLLLWIICFLSIVTGISILW